MYILNFKRVFAVTLLLLISVGCDQPEIPDELKDIKVEEVKETATEVMKKIEEFKGEKEDKKKVPEKTHFTFSIIVENVYPEGIEIELEGVEEFKNGMELKKGTYNYRVSKWGFASKTGTVDLKEDTQLSITLERPKK